MLYIKILVITNWHEAGKRRRASLLSDVEPLDIAKWRIALYITNQVIGNWHETGKWRYTFHSETEPLDVAKWRHALQYEGGNWKLS